MSDPAWKELEQSLRQIYALPHNRTWIAETGLSLDAIIQKKLQEIKSGISGTPRREDYLGPKLFLRVVGPTNRVYSGEWWFDADILENLETSYARLFFNDEELKIALRTMLREILAISKEWNPIQEVWALKLPPGERLKGFSGIGTPQKLFDSVPLSANGNRMLVGRVRQVFFPVKNPLWVKPFRNLV